MIENKISFAPGLTGSPVLSINSDGSTSWVQKVGPTGSTGLTGDTGAVGPTGANGTNGTSGLNGTSGTNGATGAQGPTGPQGATGSFNSTSYYDLKISTAELESNTVTPAGSYAIDLSLSNQFIINPTANITLDYSNAKIGTYNFLFNAGSFTISLASGKFKTIGGTWTAPSGNCIITAIYDGSKMWVAQTTNFINN
jgi:hypothetical protein